MNRLSGMLQVVVNERHPRRVTEKAVVTLENNLPNPLAAPKGKGSRIGSHSRREDARAHLPPQRSEGFDRDFKRLPGEHLFAHDHIHLQPYLGRSWRTRILPPCPS